MQWLIVMVCLVVFASPQTLARPSVIPAEPSRSVTGFNPAPMVLQPGAAPLGAVHFSLRATAPLDVTIEQIAASTLAGFVPFDESKTYPLSADNALWLHFRVQNTIAKAENWSMVLSKPFIDRVEFYFQDIEGVWRLQAAGSRVPHEQWSARGLSPQFQLPDASETFASAPEPGGAAGHRDYYLRVQKWIPLRFAVKVQRTVQLGEQTQRTFFTMGLILGLLGFMVVFSCVLCFVYLNTAYAWYAAYAAAALLASASFSGIGAYVFWPASASWTVISTMVFVLLGMAAQLGFTRAMFIAPDSPRLWSVVSALALGLMLAACAVFLTVDIARVRIAVFGVGVLGGFAVIGILVFRALRHERQIAGLYLLSFAPMLVVVVLTQIEQLGIAALPWLPYDAPIYCLVFELPLLLLALHLHAKKSHTQRVESSTLARTDPLTGFMSPALYPQTFASMWDSARTQGVDMTVVYVKVMASSAEARASAGQGADGSVLRIVRALRTVARDNDTVAHAGHDIFAILMPGVSRSERLTSKLSRLVALGVMVDSDDSRSHPVKFKIAAGTLRSFAGERASLDEALRSVLAQSDSRHSRVISFVTKLPRQPIEIDSANASATASA